MMKQATDHARRLMSHHGYGVLAAINETARFYGLEASKALELAVHVGVEIGRYHST